METDFANLPVEAVTATVEPPLLHLFWRPSTFVLVPSNDEDEDEDQSEDEDEDAISP